MLKDRNYQEYGRAKLVVVVVKTEYECTIQPTRMRFTIQMHKLLDLSLPPLLSSLLRFGQ